MDLIQPHTSHLCNYHLLSLSQSPFWTPVFDRMEDATGKPVRIWRVGFPNMFETHFAAIIDSTKIRVPGPWLLKIQPALRAVVILTSATWESRLITSLSYWTVWQLPEAETCLRSWGSHAVQGDARVDPLLEEDRPWHHLGNPWDHIWRPTTQLTPKTCIVFMMILRYIENYVKPIKHSKAIDFERGVASHQKVPDCLCAAREAVEPTCMRCNQDALQSEIFSLHIAQRGVHIQIFTHATERQRERESIIIRRE